MSSRDLGSLTCLFSKCNDFFGEGERRAVSDRNLLRASTQEASGRIRSEFHPGLTFLQLFFKQPWGMTPIQSQTSHSELEMGGRSYDSAQKTPFPQRTKVFLDLLPDLTAWRQKGIVCLAADCSEDVLRARAARC